MRGLIFGVSAVFLLSVATASAADAPVKCSYKIGDTADFTGSVSQRGSNPASITDVRTAACPGSRFEVSVSRIPDTCTDGSKISGSGKVEVDKAPAKPGSDNWLGAWVNNTFGSDYFRVAAKKVTCN